MTRTVFDTINAHLAAKGPLLKEGTIVDATIIAALPSVKNRDQPRDPEMKQTKKCNQWHFGMKAHIGVDADSGLVHSLVGTAANVGDVTEAYALLHGEETAVHADAGYAGVSKREENRKCKVDWHVAMRPGKRKLLSDAPIGYRFTARHRNIWPTRTMGRILGVTSSGFRDAAVLAQEQQNSSIKHNCR